MPDSTSVLSVPPPVHTELVENLRKPVSRIFALGWLAAALLVVPRGFGDGLHETLEMTGFLLLIVAALGRMWAYFFIGGRKNTELCRAGPYSLTRNPLYFFSFIGVIGASLALQDPVLCVVSALFFLGYYALVIRAEERRLASLFGADFTRYCQTVPRFWPRLARPDTPVELTLQSKLFTRALLEIFWFLAAIVLIDIIEAAKFGHWWPVFNLGY